jgi:hypothetical protein
VELSKKEATKVLSNERRTKSAIFILEAALAVQFYT